MNKVVTINLSGQAYQLEEGGYDALRTYLDTAASHLADNPDKEEIMSDLESALAQKCNAFLTAQKQVVTASEIEQIINEMGPVNTPGEEPKQKEPHPASPKRFYRIREGSMVGGICTGIAAYFNVDVTLVRVLLVLITIFTSGGFILAYLILMVVIPAADTPKQRAEAFGAVPFTAQELIDRAQEGYKNLKNSKEVHEWRKNLREQRRAWKKQWRQEHQAQRWQYHYQYRSSPFWEFVQGVMGMAWLAFFGFALYWGYHHIAPVHQFLDLISQWLSNLINRIG